MVKYCLFFLFSIGLTAQEIAAEKVYRSTEVESKPDLEGGMYTLTMFISDHFKFPEIKNKQMRIFTSFIIETDGTMTDEKAFYINVNDYLPVEVAATEDQKVSDQLLYDDMKVEAARVLTLFNEKWTPASLRGKSVRCLYNFPISFNIE